MREFVITSGKNDFKTHIAYVFIIDVNNESCVTSFKIQNVTINQTIKLN